MSFLTPHLYYSYSGLTSLLECSIKTTSILLPVPPFPTFFFLPQNGPDIPSSGLECFILRINYCYFFSHVFIHSNLAIDHWLLLVTRSQNPLWFKSGNTHYIPPTLLVLKIRCRAKDHVQYTSCRQGLSFVTSTTVPQPSNVILMSSATSVCVSLPTNNRKEGRKTRKYLGRCNCVLHS